jgi:hypothetical protein
VSIQPGNLIKTTRASIGIPVGTVGLVTEQHSVNGGRHGLVVYVVKLHGIGSTRRFLGEDLEVLSGL